MIKLSNQAVKAHCIPVLFRYNIIPRGPRLSLPDKLWIIISHSPRRFYAEIIIHAPLHQSIIFQRQVSVGKTSRNEHLLVIFKGKDIAVSIAESLSTPNIYSHIKYRTMQA